MIVYRNNRADSPIEVTPEQLAAHIIEKYESWKETRFARTAAAALSDFGSWDPDEKLADGREVRDDFEDLYRSTWEIVREVWWPVVPQIHA